MLPIACREAIPPNAAPAAHSFQTILFHPIGLTRLPPSSWLLSRCRIIISTLRGHRNINKISSKRRDISRTSVGWTLKLTNIGATQPYFGPAGLYEAVHRAD